VPDNKLAYPTITLLTDFGLDAPYVGSMKGVILSIQPAARVVDISHAIAPQNVRQAAWVLAETTSWFPRGSIHVAVIDPGVGTRRPVLYAEIDGRHYIAPDNGLLSLLARRHRPDALVWLENRTYWLSEVSHTFHGRDIMAPVAAHLSRGVRPAELGPPVEAMNSLDWPRPNTSDRTIEGRIWWIDSFGNLISNIDREILAELPQDAKPSVRCGGMDEIPLVRTYGDQPAGEVVALIGSSGFLEVAVVNGSAAKQLNAGPDDELSLMW